MLIHPRFPSLVSPSARRAGGFFACFKGDA